MDDIWNHIKLSEWIMYRERDSIFDLILHRCIAVPRSRQPLIYAIDGHLNTSEIIVIRLSEDLLYLDLAPRFKVVVIYLVLLEPIIIMLSSCTKLGFPHPPT